MARMVMAAVLVVLALVGAAAADKHYERILLQAIDEAHRQGPTTDAVVLVLWRSGMNKLGDEVCRCEKVTGYLERDGRLVEKRALCLNTAVEDFSMAFMPQFLRLPGKYEAWTAAIHSDDEKKASQDSEALTTDWIAAHVKAKEQAEVRRRSQRCINGSE